MVILEDVLYTLRVSDRTDAEVQNAERDDIAILPEHLFKKPERRIHERPSTNQAAGSRRCAWTLRRSTHLWSRGRGFSQAAVRIWRLTAGHVSSRGSLSG